MKTTKYVAMFCVALLFALGVVRRRDYDMPETHHEVNPPAPMIEAYGSYQGSQTRLLIWDVQEPI